MKQPAHTASAQRRTFLKAAVAAGGAGALGPLTVTAARAAPGERAAPSGPDERHAGYRATEHIQNYYKTLR